jgi:hypothetical protein
MWLYAQVINSLKKLLVSRLSIAKLLLILCLTVALCPITSSQTLAQASFNLQFPKDLSVGRLILLRPDWLAYEQFAKGTPLAEARGTVRVSGKQPLMLRANDFLSQHMTCLKSAPGNSLACLILEGLSIQNSDLAQIAHLTGLRRLELTETDIDDAALSNLSKLTNLEYLSLSSTLVKGNSLEHLNSNHLKNLHLGSLNLSAKAFRTISNFKELRWLSLGRSRVLNEGLAEVARLPMLEVLDIAENIDINDAGIKKLIALKRLRRLDVANTAVTPSGILALKGLDLKWIKLSSQYKNESTNRKLQKAFPHAGIEFDKDHHRIPAEMFAPLH